MKKSKRIARLKLTIVILCVLFVTIVLGEFVVFKFTRLLDGDNNKLDGTWTTQIECTDVMVGDITLWLSTVQGAELDVDQLRSSLEDCDISVVLSFDKKNKTYVQEIDREDYARVHDEAYKLLADTLEELTMDRLEATGITLNEVGQSLDELILATIGSSTEVYLEEIGPELLPALDTLEGQYNSSGEYSINNGKLLRDGVEESYVIGDGTLVITNATGESTIYVRK